MRYCTMVSTVLEFVFLLICVLDVEVVVAVLLPKASKQGTLSRRTVLETTFSGILVNGALSSEADAAMDVSTATYAITTMVAQAPAKNESPLLLSLDSAASKIRDSTESDPFAELLNYPHPGLRKRASPVTSFGSDLEIVVDRLIQGMESDATTPVQYGIDARIIVLKGSTMPRNIGNYGRFPPGSPIVFCNPNILARSSEDKMVPWREYCLVVGSDLVWPEGETPKASTTGSTLAKGSQRSLLEVDLLRDAVVEVAAQDLTGKPIRMTLEGEASRAFQHELDHLDGILVVDHAELEDLPPGVAFLEEPHHRARQTKAFARATFSGNGPLYY